MKDLLSETDRNVKNKTVDKAEKRRPAFSLRSIMISLIFLVGLSYIWLDIRYGVPFGLGDSLWWMVYEGVAPNTMGLLPVLILVFAVQPFFRLLRIKFKLNTGELVVINTIITIGGLLISPGFYTLYIWIMAGLGIRSLGNTINQSYANKLAGPFFVDSQALHRWILGDLVFRPYEWLVPFMTWTIFLAAIVFLMVCMATLVRKRWSDYEHLAYPIGNVRLAYVRSAETKEEPEGSLWKKKVVWIGIVIGLLYTGLPYLNKVWEWVPFVDNATLRNMRTSALSSNPLIATASYSVVNTFPLAISSLWFVSLDILFSAWFFFIIRTLFFMFFINRTWFGLSVNNYAAVRGVLQYITIGEFFGMAVTYLWLLRTDFSIIAIKALKRKGNENIDDSAEPLSYTTAFWGLIAAFLFLVFFCKVVLQVGIGWSAAMMIAMMAGIFSVARMRAEGGIGNQYGYGAYGLPHSLFTRTFGAKAIGIENLGLGALSRITSIPVTSFMATILESWNMADATGAKRRDILKAVTVGVFLAALVVFVIQLPVIYSVGYAKSAATINLATNDWIGFAGVMRTETVASDWKNGIVLMGMPFLLTIFIGLMRGIYTWWPFHPIGFIVGTSYVAFTGYFEALMFVIWLLKFLVFRWGGRKLYKGIAPIFLGLGLGQMAGLVLGVVIAVLQLIRVIV